MTEQALQALKPDAPYNAPARSIALVVDDETTNRLILRSLLSKIGYQVIQAVNGVEAVEACRAQQPDIIFMDVMMPIMNGYDAARQIKRESGTQFVPIIFLTAMTDENAVVACIEAGGDDFINKPFRNNILKAKIMAMERISRVHGSVRNLYQMIRREEEIAEQVFSRAVEAGNSALSEIHSSILPASTFSGDMLLSGYTPSGDLNVLLGDFTGHGLASALGALPASEVFRTMTAKGFSPEQILASINGKLVSMLPTGMFLAMQMVQVSYDLSEVKVINCGMPDVLLIDGGTSKIKHRFTSQCLPLAIRKSFKPSKQEIEHYEVTHGDCLFLSSDGLYEATDVSGSPFGVQRVEQIIQEPSQLESNIGSIITALNKFCGTLPQADDVSLVEIPVSEALLQEKDHTPPVRPRPLGPHQTKPDSGWGLNLRLEGKHLRESNPVPLLISQIQDLEDLAAERQSLFTVLTELFVNALDHGVLGLDSSLKATHDGFARYFEERDKRLSTLEHGFISIALQAQSFTSGGRMSITVTDSGNGFDFENYATQHSDAVMPSGRGLLLVRELCDAIEYLEPGNQVKAVYSWASNE